MTVFALRVEYDGRPFCGWQHQGGGISIQDVLERAAARLERGKPETIVAGRTDAGVHAEGQVVELRLPGDFPAEKLAAALNYHLRPHPVSVLAAAPARLGWSARFSATARVYRYRILNRPAPPALAAGRVWHVIRPLDSASMAQAAELLLGKHDFSAFRAAGCQARSPLRTLDRLEVQRSGESIDITAEARSFLYHQVRNMVGTLKLVGEGSWPPGRVAAVLAGRDRRQAGPTAPAAGLTLLAVRYALDPFGRSTEAEKEPRREEDGGSADVDHEDECHGSQP